MAEKQITINAPVDKVFSYVADLPRHSEWAKHPLKVEQTSSGPAGQGATFKSVGHEMGRDNEETVTITEYRPNERLVYEVEGNQGHFRHWIQVQPGEGGAQVSKGLEIVKAKFPYSILLPLMAPFVVPGALAGDLQRIREKVEGN